MKVAEELNEKGKYWQEIIHKQEKSKESAKEYCEKNGVGIKSLFRWKKILRDKGLINKAKREKPADKFQTIPIIRSKQQREPEAIKIHFPNGMMVEIAGEVSAERIKTILSQWI